MSAKPCHCGASLAACPTHETEADDVHRLIRGLVERHHDELDKLRDENRRLAKENSGLWEDVHDRDDKITTLQQMLERAHTSEDA